MDHVIWKNGRDDTLIQGDLTLVEEEENMKVLINQTGLYFVYTQATFDCTRFIYRKPSHISRISHQVKLFSIKQNEDINLLSAHKTISTGGPTSIYEGGLFMLNSGDKLYTVTNSSDCVIMKRKGGETYFGLYAW
ncbi:tumor necrosis factor-like [Hyperolius riggenbachi]|uniref:tumor necrosis factor-like n=1 Tax=Hyperolius riggenbachi TaxID=752182 RepID=UPI0035A3BCD3